MKIDRVSRLYKGAPWGKEDQPWFLNVAARGRCPLAPDDLLAFAKQVEAGAGRKPRGRWGPRELDVDIVLMGERVVRKPRLVVPHPGLAHRRFCLAPVSEIAPGAIVLPGGKSIRDLLEDCGDPLEVYPL